MTATQLAAIVYALATAVVVGFQVALAAGAPWGEYAMGGRFPGVRRRCAWGPWCRR